MGIVQDEVNRQMQYLQNGYDNMWIFIIAIVVMVVSSFIFYLLKQRRKKIKEG